MDNYEIMYRVYDHLMTQNEKSIDGVGNCKYRSPDGMMCALGCLIPDEEYKITTEGETPTSLTRVVKDLEGSNTELLGALQELHDDSDPIEWEAELMDLADRYAPETVGKQC